MAIVPEQGVPAPTVCAVKVLYGAVIAVPPVAATVADVRSPKILVFTLLITQEI